MKVEHSIQRRHGRVENAPEVAIGDITLQCEKGSTREKYRAEVVMEVSAHVAEESAVAQAVP